MMLILVRNTKTRRKGHPIPIKIALDGLNLNPNKE
jgi:hypothetical protein